MYVSKLSVQGVRNIQQSLLHPKANINIIYGENGSGKTSLLEAIYLLGRGRSFRTTNLKAAINRASEACTVFALLEKEGASGGSAVPIGVSRSSGGGFVFKVAGRQVYTSSQLAETLPIVLMNSDSFALVEGGPGHRRRFIDWGVFHVEHSFRETLRKYQRCHKQRNNLLRHDKISTAELGVWDREFIGLSIQVAECRQRYFDKVLPEFHSVLRSLNRDLNIDLHLFRGWAEGSSLDIELTKNYQRDRVSKTTNSGAHRADLKLKYEGRPASDVLSRGQTKVVVLAMLIAQGRVLRRQRNQDCVYLLDDLAAELDKAHLSRGMDLLLEQNAQIFMTGTNKEALQTLVPKALVSGSGLFHVKQGVVDQEEPDLI
ncbi:MAG: DNA replication/repair protein RecF [Porticoccaceae bacterium]|nr:DNA replication/repair protein RecF [Porticoccaceae bacterium]